jgi:hypothetical protein
MRPDLWPLNLTLCFLFVAAVIVCTVGLVGTPTWFAVMATITFSWVPFLVIYANWYRNLLGRTASVVIGVIGLVVGWNVIGELQKESFEQLLWCGGAFALVSPFMAAAVLSRVEGRYPR